MPPGGGFPFGHVHEDWEEVFYVLEGEVEYRLGEAWLPAPTGSTICVPPGAVHAFRNSSQTPGRARAGRRAAGDRRARASPARPVE
jgi:quercetin dioxygenase-like cupin family protein